MDTTQDGLGGTLLSVRDISEGFDRLIAANRLFGAELNPLVLYREQDRVVPFLPFPTRPGHRVVYVEGITLSAQRPSPG